MIRIKRVYEPPSGRDGVRILVERLWPRGLTREHAAVDLWLKDAAPSAALRRWYSHDPAKWERFRARYWAELRENPSGVEVLLSHARRGTVTLVHAARDEDHTGARALLEFLKRGRSAPRKRASR